MTSHPALPSLIGLAALLAAQHDYVRRPFGLPAPVDFYRNGKAWA